MTENKFTDNEIIKGLKLCTNKEEKYCKDCPFIDEMNCVNLLTKHALDLTNRRQAEIERLQGLLDGWKTEAYKVADEKDKLYCEAVERVKAVKSEVVAEFGKFLIDKAENGVIDVTNIPDYVQELVGEQNV